MAMLAIGARLLEQSHDHAADTGSGRLAWLTARYIARLGGEPVVSAIADDASWLEHAEPLLYGGPVPLEFGEAAARRVAAALQGAPQLAAAV
jgi:hypothetical protein